MLCFELLAYTLSFSLNETIQNRNQDVCQDSHQHACTSRLEHGSFWSHAAVHLRAPLSQGVLESYVSVTPGSFFNSCFKTEDEPIDSDDSNASILETDVDYDKHKQDSLKKQKDGAGHWKPELASDSEEAVKADRHSHDDPKTLAEKTKRAAEESSKAGTSVRDSM